MKKYFLITIVFLSCILLDAQSTGQIEVIYNESHFNIPVYKREGTAYISIKSLADNLKLKTSFDEKTEKLKVNFPVYQLIVTARDPFLVLRKPGEKQSIIQLPTSTYLIKNQIYIPLKYSLEALKKASGIDMVLQSSGNLVLKKASNIVKNGSSVKSKNKASSAYDIYDLNLDEKSNGALIRLNSKKRIFSYNSAYKNGILTISLRNVRADTAIAENEIDTSGLVKRIKIKNIKSDTELRIAVGKEYSSSEVINVDNSNDLQIAIYNKAFENNPVKKAGKNKWDFNVIVLDAGHGGKDTGTLGVDGVREKDVNLAVALKVGNYIQEHMRDVKVVYTRKTDKFIELYRRGQIANEAGGKLFISIHCNATPEKPSNANGFEVYLLRPGRTKEAISIASRENSVIKYEDNPSRYKKLTDENFILVSMAQSAYMRYSEKFADLLNKEVGKDNIIEPRGVKQAGFYVLVGASMPSVLIETGFLSNRKDEHYLNTSKGQSEIAESIFSAIKKFRDVYEQNIESD